MVLADSSVPIFSCLTSLIKVRLVKSKSKGCHMHIGMLVACSSAFIRLLNRRWL